MRVSRNVLSVSTPIVFIFWRLGKSRSKKSPHWAGWQKQDGWAALENEVLDVGADRLAALVGAVLAPCLFEPRLVRSHDASAAEYGRAALARIEAVAREVFVAAAIVVHEQRFFELEAARVFHRVAQHLRGIHGQRAGAVTRVGRLRRLLRGLLRRVRRHCCDDHPERQHAREDQCEWRCFLSRHLRPAIWAFASSVADLLLAFTAANHGHGSFLPLKDRNGSITNLPTPRAHAGAECVKVLGLRLLMRCRRRSAGPHPFPSRT